ncbi:NRAMP family divalent metal transporter [Candidatus Halobonum tyrrellensis]|uniref:Mn2+/Fe2-transporter, NRAMP family protein n=1 Tax=Candidatus Halobonum tyrrellensis G22 TaxID=1324957 RepID=V4IYW4_9EURY|nr:divalent metal cation transporter [Candidatus Halobonum tyrrellensis]ESP88297.1 Mn2+/Fe2- transporter, NRAMP family protein [Candidatus Halobonum tyrrellensis G22]
MSTSSGSGLRDAVSGFFQEYGLAFVMVASYFGSGSVFIASSAGVRYGYALLWAVVGAALLGFMGQDMSARLGIFGESLMTFIRGKLGETGALVVSLLLSVGCVAWALELTAAVGKGISILLGGAVGWMPLAVLTGLAAVVTGVLNYEGIERVMTVMMLTLLVIYLVVAGASAPDLGAFAAGFVPSTDTFGDPSALTFAAGIVGTTALWPNFFLESNLVSEKGWTDADDVSTMRRDLGIGYAVGAITTVAIVIAAAAVLRPAGYTSLETFITPGRALADVLGQWAMTLFLLGAVAAAFNSIVPIMWAPAYMIQNARGKEADSGTREFKLIYAVGAGIGCLSPLVTILFGLSVVDMILLFPAYNGIVGLPITVVFLFWALNDSETMGEWTNGAALTAANLVLVVLALFLSATSAPSFFETVTTGGF